MLADASSRLASSIDYETTLKTVAELLVPQLAEGCVIDVVETDGTFRRIAATHVDPEKARGAKKLLELPPPAPDAPVHAVLASTEPIVSAEIDEAHLRASSRSPEHFEILKKLEVRSGMICALRALGSPRGALWLFSSTHRHYRQEEVILFRELAARAATAIENARLFQRAREAVALRDEFLSVASHELNTPLASLRLIIDSLLRLPHEPVVLGRLQTADRQVTRLGALVSQLLDVSRFGARRVVLEREPLDLAAVARDVLASLAGEIEKRKVTVRLDAPVGAATGTWDRQRVEQILLNLLTNALKYGGGAPVDVKVTATDDEATATVIDRGLGIAPEDQTRVFQRFERAVSSQHYGGLGLGLWIAREIAMAHAGELELVESAPGKGSTFRLRLPRA